MMIPEGFKFRIEELVDLQSFTEWGEGCWNFFPQESLDMIHGIRTYFDRPITINNWLWGGPFQERGYRGPSSSIGALKSYHKRGMAFDFDVKDMTAEEVRREIIDNQENEHLRLIQRMERAVTWCHVDRGPVPNGYMRVYLFNP